MGPALAAERTFVITSNSTLHVLYSRAVSVVTQSDNMLVQKDGGSGNGVLGLMTHLGCCSEKGVRCRKSSGVYVHDPIVSSEPKSDLHNPSTCLPMFGHATFSRLG